MYPSVLANFQAFSSRFEGVVPHMYLDVKGLVTTGIGNLIDDAASAQALPWTRPDGSRATPDEIATAWHVVKSHQEMKLKGGMAFGPLTSIRLTHDALDQLFRAKLASNDAVLKKRFPNFEQLHADAQLGLHSLAWAQGPYFHMPKLEDAINRPRPNYRLAALESKMNDTDNPGLVPRNAANRVLFTNAEAALRRHRPPEVLHWPAQLPAVGSLLPWMAGLGAAVGGFLLFRAAANDHGLERAKKEVAP